MANANTEPRALQAALAAPAFSTRGARLASRVADRHVERWAPETGAQRVRSMRSLGFVDRLVSPWIETAQRSASLRMFAGYARNGVAERQGGDVSWVFPRPWYQDELAWMAAARRQREEESYASESSAPAMFTTRGTYVAPSQSERAVVPSALYEFVAPSLSVASPQPLAAPVGRVGEAYSPLVPLAAVAAAQLMNRAIAPLGRSPVATERPALRAMLATMLQRAAVNADQPSRVSTYAPELVTPPAPRASDVAPATDDAVAASPEITLAERYAAQRTQIVELQRIAEQSARRELAARVETARREAAHAVEATRTADAPRAPAARTETVRAEAIDAAQRAERARIEDRIAQRLAERRLHEESRTAAAEHARSLEAPAPVAREVAPAARVPAELGAAIASLPPDLAAYLGARPERAAQAIAELNEVLRTAELLARTSAAGGSVEVARGPRLVMPAGLGGLIATVERAQPVPQMIASPSAFAAPSAPPRARRDVRVPTLAWIQPTALRTAAPSALGATAAAAPAALAHVAWSDRWLARFTGASTRSLDVLQATSASPELRMQALAAAAPESVFVAPSLAPVRAVAGDELAAPATPESAPLQRFADDDETPDSVFEQIAASAASSRTPPSWQAPQPAAPVAPTVEAIAGDAERFTLADAVVRGAPSAPNAGMSAGLAASPFAPALKHLLPLPASLPFDVRALFGGGVSATYLAGLLASETDEVDVPNAAPAWARWASSEQAIAPMLGERATPELDFTYVAPEADVASRAANDEEAVAATREELAPLTTLRTALLSWTAEAAASPGAPAPTAGHTAITISGAQAAPATHATARAMVDAMALPMLGDAAHDDAPVSWAMPGMIADRAQGWSVAQERSASDLSLDFVTPELVLAARVYGLGPAEAAQAARLALAGPGQLTAMASAVDRTFVQALAIDAERREGRTATGERGPDGASVSVDGPSAARAEAFEPTRTPSAFGVERRAPRGAFLWPSASVGAMGLSAAAPDGQQSMSVAALELLAAQAVAELGTYAALGEPDGASPRGRADATSASASTTPSASTIDTDGMLNDSAGEAEVLTAAAAIVPAARRARFDALYVALSQTPSARSWSPAARAARALALAGRGEEAPASAYERAAAAWDVLPVVYATDGASIVDTLDPPTAERAAELQIARAARGPRDMVHVDGRPGLGALSSRAGEALGSYVAPANAPSTPATAAPSARSERETGAVMRAPTAAQELVRTGRPSGRHGGGEVEIPPWFEAAARKMLEDRSGNADGISLAELTLVTAAPSTHIAASTRTAPSAQPVAPAAASGSDSAKNGEPIDIDKIANEVYRQILVMMDAARARNGEPYL